MVGLGFGPPPPQPTPLFWVKSTLINWAWSIPRLKKKTTIAGKTSINGHAINGQEFVILGVNRAFKPQESVSVPPPLALSGWNERIMRAQPRKPVMRLMIANKVIKHRK